MTANQTHIFTGYRPDYVRALEQLARENSRPSDILRRSAPVSMSDLRQTMQTLSLAPIDSASSKRTVIIDLTGMKRDAQTSLLLVAESPPAMALLLLHTPVLQSVLPTLVSRSTVHRFKVPKYGQLLVDLTRSGMDLAEAAKQATRLGKGFAQDAIPDDGAITAAETLVAAARNGDIEQGIRVAAGFDEKALAALREMLSHPKRYQLLPETYSPLDAPGAALLLFQRIVARPRV